MRIVKILCFVTFMTSIVFAQTGLVDDFQDNTLTGWNETPDYDLTEANGVLQIDANKRDTWNSFTFSFSALDISEHPYVSLKVKAKRDFNLGFSVWDGADNYEYPPKMYQEIVASEHFVEYVFDFSGIADKVDLTDVVMLNFVFNPGGALRFNGKVWFDDVRIGEAAHVFSYMTTIPRQSHYINSAKALVPFRGVENIVQGDQPLSITASSSNTDLIPDPTVHYTPGEKTGTLEYTPQQDKSGTTTITVQVTGNAPDPKIVPFDVVVENNKPPTMNPVDDVYASAGTPMDIRLTGINDGNPNAEQKISLSAASSDTLILSHPVIHHDSTSPNAVLAFKPKDAQTGTVMVTIKLKDNGGTVNGGVDSSSTNFQVTVFDDVNDPPTIAPIDNMSVLEGSGEHHLTLTGIDDGDAEAVQHLIITAKSSNTSLIPDPSINYSSPDSTALLSFAPHPGKTGSAQITVTVADDGGTATNNGDESVSTSFIIEVRQKPTVGFEDEFNDGELGSKWPPDWGVGPGEGSHRCFEENGVMRIEIDKTRSGNKWAGLWYSIPEELDLTEYPYVSITMKTDVPGTEMLIFLWDANDHYNTAKTVRHTVTDEYKEYYFDFTGLNLQGDGTEVDFSRIKALLFNFDPGGDDPLFQGNFYFDDFRVGTYAHRPPVTPTATMDPIADLALPKDAGEQQVILTGISDGADGSHPVTLTTRSSNRRLIPDASVSPVENGRATLSFKVSPGRTGSSTIRVTVTADSSRRLTSSFDINVVPMRDVDAVNVDVNLSEEFQTIDGFGAFMGTGSGMKNEQVLNLAVDIGMSVARFGVINNEFEPVNDNSDPNVMAMEHFHTSAVPLRTIRWLRDNADVDKYILSWWSPPAWMKRNKALSAEYWATDNKLEPHYYEEYAEHVAAMIKMIKNETGIDLYAISLQNEPQFNEPYPSCQINPREMRDLIKVVGPRLEREGLDTKIYWAEALPPQNSIDDYIFAVKNDPEAAKYVDIVATHNYDEDGINVGGPGAKQWAQIYEWAQNPDPALPTWMTETSGHANTWQGALNLAGNIYNALGYGNVSAWIWWSFNADRDSERYGLVVDNEPTSRYYISKHYYKYIRPGAVRVYTLSEHEDVPCLTFKNPQLGKVTVVMINKSAAPQVVGIAGRKLPSFYERYTSVQHRYFAKEEPVNAGELFLLPANSISTLVGDYDPTVVEDEAETLPETFKLFQNYPNPFNPTTTVQFQVPKTGHVHLSVYNVLGQKVRTLVDRVVPGGTYSQQWNGTNDNGQPISTGVYFIRFQAGGFVDVKKGLLVR